MKLPDIHHWFYVPLVCIGTYFFVQAERKSIEVGENVNKATAQLVITTTMVNATLKGDPKKGDPGLLNRASLMVANADLATQALKKTMQQLDRASTANEPKAALLADAGIAAVKSGQGAIESLNGAIGKLGGSMDTLNGVIAVVRDGTLPKVNTGIDSLNRVVAGLEPAEKSANDLLVSGNSVMLALKTTVGSANALIADPDLTAVAKNLADGTKSGASALAHVDKAMGYVELDLSPKHIPIWQTLLEGAIGNVIGIPFKRISQSVSVVNTVTTK